MGPTVLLVCSPESAALQHALPALADLPCARLPDAAAVALPAIGWQQPAMRAAAARLASARSWLVVRAPSTPARRALCGVAPAVCVPAVCVPQEWATRIAAPRAIPPKCLTTPPSPRPLPLLQQEHLEAAAYAHLPLGALGSDWVLDAADALFARALRDAGCLLWAADSAQPDVAGRPRDLGEAATLREQGRLVEVRGHGGRVRGSRGGEAAAGSGGAGGGVASGVSGGGGKAAHQQAGAGAGGHGA
jgi:DNA polymerase epsilon subunit 1